MNNEINIAEILKDCPKGTKLYSPLFGNVTLEEVDTSITVPIKIIDSLNSYNCFTKTGLYYNRIRLRKAQTAMMVILSRSCQRYKVLSN